MRNPGIGERREETVRRRRCGHTIAYTRRVLPQVPHAGAWAEPVTRDNVKPASGAAHAIPFGDPIQESKNVARVFIGAEVLGLNVTALDDPHLDRRPNAYRLQRSERHWLMGRFLAPHLNDPRLSVLVPGFFVPHWVTIADNRLAISISRSCAACW
jgi:hypothetical protein